MLRSPPVLSYAGATRYLYGLAPRGVQLGLTRVQRALALRNHPERAVPAILVAGTNGKGSVASLLASVLRAQGYRTGLYTSPHLHRMTERFVVNGKAVTQRSFAQRVSELVPFFEDSDTPELTFFEACTLLAFEIFRDLRCDINVLEVGLGGRLDATNVVKPLVSVISSIALDHQERLGPTVSAIAREKAGIVWPKVPVVVGTRDAAALRVIAATARARKAPYLRIDRDFSVSELDDGCTVSVQDRTYAKLPLPLAGAHQRDNLACAVAALDQLSHAREQLSKPSKPKAPVFAISERALRSGVAHTRWPGRLELLPGAPSTLLDAAHNPEACASLAQQVKTLAKRYKRRVLVFGAMRDKDHATMLRTLLPEVDPVVFATPDTPRAEPAQALCQAYGGVAVADPREAFARAQKLAGKRGLVIVAGSIFLIAPIRAQILGLGMDATIAM